MVDDTPLWYWFILGCVLVLRSIAPLSISYTAFRLLYRAENYHLPWPLEYWAYAETIFYGLFYIYRHYYLQSPTIHPALLPVEQRRELVERCLIHIPDYEEYFAKWFLDASFDDIKRENLKDFFRWAFLNTDIADPIYDEELDQYVSRFEQKIGRKFEAGRSNVKCQKLSIDRTVILHRSLWWYTCVGFVDFLTWNYMTYHRFHFHHPSFFHAFRRLPIRPWTALMAKASPADDISYWHRPHRSTTKAPIVFLHGVGVGFYPYLTFLKEINQRNVDDDEIGILAVELPHISSTMGPAAPDTAVFCKQLLTVLKYHKLSKFVLVSHSFGTFISAQLLRDSRIAERISSIVLIDPVSILLHLPDVANNFMIRKPKTANQWQLWYFGSKDAGVAHTLSRRFCWSENIIWKEELQQYYVTVFLSERDLLINTKYINQYLLDQPEEFAASGTDQLQDQPNLSGQNIEVVQCPGLDHGQLFDSNLWRSRLLKAVYKHSQSQMPKLAIM